jgi:hypothetical protein
MPDEVLPPSFSRQNFMTCETLPVSPRAEKLDVNNSYTLDSNIFLKYPIALASVYSDDDVTSIAESGSLILLLDSMLPPEV